MLSYINYCGYFKPLLAEAPWFREGTQLANDAHHYKPQEEEATYDTENSYQGWMHLNASTRSKSPV